MEKLKDKIKATQRLSKIKKAQKKKAEQDEQLAAAARGVERQQASRAYKEGKRTISQQMQDAAKQAEADRGQSAPKKNAPDRGER